MGRIICTCLAFFLDSSTYICLRRYLDLLSPLRQPRKISVCFLVFYFSFNDLLVKPRRYLRSFIGLLVHSSWHERVDHNSIPTHPEYQGNSYTPVYITKQASSYLFLNALLLQCMMVRLHRYGGLIKTSFPRQKMMQFRNPLHRLRCVKSHLCLRPNI